MTTVTQQRPRVPRMRAKLDKMPDSELVKLALAKWNGPLIRFAEDVVGVTPVTMRRWRSGESALNKRKRQWLINYISPAAL